VLNWEVVIKAVHCQKIAGCEFFAMPGIQLLGQILNQRFTVSSPLFTLLFIFDNLPPDFPVGANHFMFDNCLMCLDQFRRHAQATIRR